MANNFITTAGDGTGKTFLAFEAAGGVNAPGGIVVFATDTTDGASNWHTPLAAALTDNTANPTTILHGSCGMVYDGATWDMLRGDATNGMLVNLGANNHVTLAVLPDTAGGALAAMVVDLAAIEIVLGTIDADTGAIATSAASIDGKIVACNTGSVTVAASALPSGAATAANQATIITSLQLIDDAVYTHGSGTTSKGLLIQGKTGTTPYCWTVDSSGNGMVRTTSHSNLLCAADLYQGEAQVGSSNGVYTRPQAGQTWPVSGTVTANAGTNLNTSALALEAGGNLAAIATDAAAIEVLLTTIDADTSTLAVVGGGTEATALRVTIASDSTGVLSIDDNSGSLTVDLPAVATGGATPGKLVSAASTNATSVKGSAGTLYSMVAMTTDATPVYLKLYNKASAPTVGTDTPVQVFMLPGNATGAGCVIPIPTCGIEFATGIAFALTTGAADSDTGAVAANEVVVSYSYK